jgi:hypothetical protein
LLAAGLVVVPAEPHGVGAGLQTDHGCLHVIAAEARAWVRANLLLGQMKHVPFNDQRDDSLVATANLRGVPVQRMKRTGLHGELRLFVFRARLLPVTRPFTVWLLPDITDRPKHPSRDTEYP